MKVFNLFSRRLRDEHGEVPDTYQYVEMPDTLRVQFVHIMDDGLGNEQDYHDPYGYGDTKGLYDNLVSVLRREYGVFHLLGDRWKSDNSRLELINFFLNERSMEKLLDVVELVCRAFEKVTNEWPGKFSDQAEPLIAEVNHRFRESALGYQYISGSVVRVDSDFSHAEIVKPALTLLRDRKLKTVEKEFLAAHQHYRSGEYQDCLVDCGCSIESMMKIILEEMKVKGSENMNANALAKAIFDNIEVPNSLEAQFNSLRSLITNGVPTLRNKLGAHGHGNAPKNVTEGIASYSINLTASTLLLLESFRKS